MFHVAAVRIEGAISIECHQLKALCRRVDLHIQIDLITYSGRSILSWLVVKYFFISVKNSASASTQLGEVHLKGSNSQGYSSA